MKKLILASLLMSAPALAQIDTSIYNNSGNYGGNQRAYQMPVYQAPTYQAPARQTDYSCVSDCTSAGYLYNLCVSKCSY